ncbi:MAG: SurA N-terminal domain-containing protein, partial [Eggerthellaceae bacterium]|nr:SurA N-terminal domain-containing protein [Eggerthellaceae bacterium]
MKKTRFVTAALVACVVVACMFGLAACSNSSGDSASGGTAATVNGTAIPEQKVTDQVEQIREQSGLTEEDQWGQFLVENDMTPSSVRQQIIDTLTEQEVIMQGAAELGITVEDSEVDEYINNMKGNYDSDEAWTKALEQAGFTEDSYRETIKESLYEQKVGEYYEGKAEVTDEDIVTSAQTYASYYDGSKRSSHILFGVDDTSDEAAMDEAKKQAE